MEEDLKASQLKNTTLLDEIESKTLEIKNAEERLTAVENSFKCNKASSEENEKVSYCVYN